MKKSIESVFLAIVFLTVLVSGCTPKSTPIPSTPTAIPSTGPLTANCASENNPPLNISDEEGVTQILYTTGKIPVTTAAGENAFLTITFNKYDSTSYASGIWRLQPTSSQHYMGRWDTEITNNSLEFNRENGEPSLVLTAQLDSSYQATGTLTLLNNTFDWKACALTTYPEVDPASNVGTIEGNVFNSNLAKGLTNITVNLSRKLSEEETQVAATTITDENGYFRFDNVESGSYSIAVETDAASPFCRPPQGLVFFVPSFLLPKSGVGFVLTGTTQDGRNIQSIGGILLDIETGNIVYVDIETACG